MNEKVHVDLNKSAIVSKIANNLNISDTSLGSYLHTLVDGISDVSAITTTKVNSAINDIFLDTASEDILEEYGAKKGIPRMKSRNVFTKNTSAEISIQPTFHVYTKDYNIKLFEKGEVINVDILKITFVDDVYYNSNVEKVFVSCEISSNNKNISKNYLVKDQKFNLPVPKKLSNIFSSLSLNIETNLSFTDYEEDINLYRIKLKTYALSENISSKSTVEKAISISQGVYKYFIDKSTYPFTVYYMSPLLYYNFDFEEYVETTEYFLRFNTDLIRGYTSNFEFKLPEKIIFSINIKTTNTEGLAEALNNFISTFLEKHTLGYKLIINKEYFSEFFMKYFPDFSQPFDVEFFYTDGITYVPTEKIDEIIINENQYPKVYSITLNEVYNDTVPFI